MYCVPDRASVTADGSACVEIECNDQDGSGFPVIIPLIDLAIAVDDGDFG